MTRINCIPVQELTREHLVAEYRELPRIYKLVDDALDKQHECFIRPRIPARYTMGTGHVLFFYNKMAYITRRHRELIEEMQRRGFTTNHTDVPNLRWPKYFNMDWEPDAEEERINRERIHIRLWMGGHYE